ncbi:MAG: hypothetical protein IIA44_12755, partial [Acidobacteria bacterium]|nr:hypothetical protein [Acidobacteriota bacterium]
MTIEPPQPVLGAATYLIEYDVPITEGPESGAEGPEQQVIIRPPAVTLSAPGGREAETVVVSDILGEVSITGDASFKIMGNA